MNALTLMPLRFYRRFLEVLPRIRREPKGQAEGVRLWEDALLPRQVRGASEEERRLLGWRQGRVHCVCVNEVLELSTTDTLMYFYLLLAVLGRCALRCDSRADQQLLGEEQPGVVSRVDEALRDRPSWAQDQGLPRQAAKDNFVINLWTIHYCFKAKEMKIHRFIIANLLTFYSSTFCNEISNTILLKCNFNYELHEIFVVIVQLLDLKFDGLVYHKTFVLLHAKSR